MQKEFQPSPYQQEIFDFTKYGHGNAVVNAKAGSSKSTTAVKAIDFLKPDKKVLFLAFNNSIVEELASKITRPNTDVKTLHSLGYSLLKFNFKHINITIDDNKYKKKLNQLLEDVIILVKQKKYVDNILKLTDLGRFYLSKNEKDLQLIATKHNITLLSDEINITLDLIKWSKISLEETNTIDFGDMLYLPNVLPIRTLKYDFIIVDEAQDLSVSQLQLFLKCFKQGGRFLALGDEKQCINGFAGSDLQSFSKLKALPKTIELPLSICYRCPTNVIKYVQKLVPTIEAHENAIPGFINYDATIDDVKDGDMIICRNTLPLINLYIDLLANNKKAYVKGKDVGHNLINIINNIEQDDLNTDLDQIGVFSELYNNVMGYIYQTKETLDISEADVFETQEFNNLMDNIDCLETLSIGLNSKDELVTKINNIFHDKNKEGICLSTIHKAKGLEADNVYVLNKHLMPSKFIKQDWEMEQEKNLEYVAYTRPKKVLGFIFSKDSNTGGLSNSKKINVIKNKLEIIY